jgi:hypothetical protein
VCGTFLDLLSSTGTDVPAGREGSGSTQPRPAHTDGSRAPLDFPLGDAGPRDLSRGFTVHAEAAMRFCRLRAMHQPELLADNHASSSGWFGAGSATPAPTCGRPEEMPARARVELRQLGRWRHGSPVGQGSVHHGWSQGPRSFTRRSSRPRRGRCRGERCVWSCRGQHGAGQHS